MEYRSVKGGDGPSMKGSPTRFEPYWVCRRCAVYRRRNYYLVLAIGGALAIAGLVAFVLNRL
jgi:hypothetical protein